MPRRVLGQFAAREKKFENKGKRMGENEEKLVEIKSEKISETDSEEEFFYIDNKEVKKEIHVESEMASENKGFTLQVFDKHITTNGSTNSNNS